MNNTLKIQRQLIEKGGEPKHKYNFPLHNHIESMTGEPSDRSAYDVGSEQEKLSDNNK